jgi:hypothetical protein
VTFQQISRAPPVRGLRMGTAMYMCMSFVFHIRGTISSYGQHRAQRKPEYTMGGCRLPVMAVHLHSFFPALSLQLCGAVVVISLRVNPGAQWKSCVFGGQSRNRKIY